MKTNYMILSVLTACLVMQGCLKEDVNEAEGTLNPEVSLTVLRAAYKGSDVTIGKDQTAGASYTGGVVVSNHENGNLPDGLIAIQGSWRGQDAGIFVRVPNSSQYAFGDSVRVELLGAKLIRSDGALTIDGLGDGDVTILSSGLQKSYKSVSIAAVLSNPGLYEGQLVSVTADFTPDIAAGDTFSGAKSIVDGTNSVLTLFTETSASFADEPLAPSATFQGLIYAGSDGPQLRMQKAEDMMYPSGKIYPGWPESFEEPYQGKTSYNVAATNNLLDMATGTWWLYQVIQGETAGRDRIVTGKQALRFQQNRSDDEFAQMNFDVPNGASKVTFWYGSYYTDRSCTFQLEYSVDQGTTWQLIGEPITDAHMTTESADAKQAIFLMDIAQPVRFRINKRGLGTSSDVVNNGRLGVDDFAIYQSY